MENGYNRSTAVSLDGGVSYEYDLEFSRPNFNGGGDSAYNSAVKNISNNSCGNLSNVYCVSTAAVSTLTEKSSNGLRNQHKDIFKTCKQNGKEKEAYQQNGGVAPSSQQKQKSLSLPVSEKACVDYNPHEHIQHKHPTSYWGTTFHLLKASLGTGILAMPNAFHNAGYLVGTIGTLVIGFLCTYNIHLLVSSEYELCRRKRVPFMTYPETVQSAFEEGPKKLRWFAPYGKFITDLFLFVYQIGSSAIYTVFIASNLKDVYDSYYDTNVDVRIIMVYILVPLILICWIRNLKLLVPFSTIANAATILSFVLIFHYVFTDIPSLGDRKPVGTIEEMPLFFGTVLFAMEAIGMIMPLKNQMKTPEKFGSVFGVLNASMLPISLLYTFVGFFGYLKYGEEIKGSITLNLPNKDIRAQMVKLLYSASIYITYALSCYVAYDILWSNAMKKSIVESKVAVRIFWEYVVRTSIVLVTFVMAVVIPNLEIFISFIGAFCLSTIGIALPAIIQILIHWDDHPHPFIFAIFIFKNIIILMIAILAFTIGVSTSVSKFMHEML